MTIREEITLELDGVGDLILALCGTLGHVEDSQEDIKIGFGFGH